MTSDEGQERMNNAARELLKTPEVQERLSRPFADTVAERMERDPEFKMLISKDRLSEKIASDPDEECEAR